MTNEERIKADAEKVYPIPVKFSDQPACMERREGYIAGATAEQQRAQELADALEWIKRYGPCDELTVKFIDNAIEQWRGKEVGDGT